MANLFTFSIPLNAQPNSLTTPVALALIEVQRSGRFYIPPVHLVENQTCRSISASINQARNSSLLACQDRSITYATMQVFKPKSRELVANPYENPVEILEFRPDFRPARLVEC